MAMSGWVSYAIDRVIRMTRLVLINGAPGSGKSTLADGLAQNQPMTLALDVDVIKHSLGRWSDVPSHRDCTPDASVSLSHASN